MNDTARRRLRAISTMLITMLILILDGRVRKMLVVSRDLEHWSRITESQCEQNSATGLLVPKCRKTLVRRTYTHRLTWAIKLTPLMSPLHQMCCMVRVWSVRCSAALTAATMPLSWDALSPLMCCNNWKWKNNFTFTCQMWQNSKFSLMYFPFSNI